MLQFNGKLFHSLCMYWASEEGEKLNTSWTFVRDERSLHLEHLKCLQAV